MSFVCVQPMLTSWARRSGDLTFDKTDEKDPPRQTTLPRAAEQRLELLTTGT
jgi:hypothetical protein